MRGTPDRTAHASGDQLRLAPTGLASVDPRSRPYALPGWGILVIGCGEKTTIARRHAKATVATGHKILTAAYHVLDRGVPYHELGEEFFYRRDTEHTERYRRRLIHQLERLGHKVTLQPLPEAA